MKKENIYTTSFSDYLKEKNGKFVAFISSNQYAIEIEKDFSHEGMRNDLVKKTRPNIKLDNWGNAIDPNDDYRNDTIVLLGSPSEVWIEFPLKQMLNIEQYKCLCDILTNIDSYNKESSSKYAIHAYGFGMIEIEAKDYTNSIKELINRLTNKSSAVYEQCYRVLMNPLQLAITLSLSL